MTKKDAKATFDRDEKDTERRNSMTNIDDFHANFGGKNVMKRANEFK